MKNGPSRIKDVVKIRGHTDLRTMKKGPSKIENQSEIWYNMIQNCQMTAFGEQLGQL